MSWRSGRHGPVVPDDTGILAADVLWRSDDMGSMEHCAIWRRDDGWTVSSTTVLTIDGGPAHITARIHADARWHTEAVVVDVHARQARRVEIAVRGGEWTVDRKRRHDLDGCRDVDLGWTPATNLLPLRRLELDVGDEAVVDVAWLRFPEFELERVQQTYHRLGECMWRYRSGAADHLVDVDEFGLVTRYGDGLWTTVPTRH